VAHILTISPGIPVAFAVAFRPVASQFTLPSHARCAIALDAEDAPTLWSQVSPISRDPVPELRWSAGFTVPANVTSGLSTADDYVWGVTYCDAQGNPVGVTGLPRCPIRVVRAVA